LYAYGLNDAASHRAYHFKVVATVTNLKSR
jgi:hypothetical protein